MKPVRWLWLLACAALIGCADGGPVGTGIASSSISGNVAAVDATMRSTTALTQPVHVRIVEIPTIEDTTDTDGNFKLTGDFSGAITLRFTAGPISATTDPIDVPLGSDVLLEDVTLSPGTVGFVKPQLRRFLGRIAFVDCASDVSGAAEILADDRKPTTTNQFLIRLSPDTIIIRGDGVLLQCAQLKNADPIGIEGVIRPDRTVDAIVLVVTPRPPAEPQPIVELRFRGTVNVVNCDQGFVQLFDDAVGALNLQLLERSALVDAGTQPTTCDAISVGGRIEGRGLKAGRIAPILVVRATVRLPLQQ